MRKPLTRTSEHSLIKTLRGVPDFATLDDETLLEVAGCSMNLLWPAGSLVFEKGAPGEALFIVISGKVLIYDVVDGAEQEITVMPPGNYFGEMSLLLEATHSKSARVLEDAELLAIPKSSFQQLLTTQEHLKTHLENRVAKRLGER